MGSMNVVGVILLTVAIYTIQATVPVIRPSQQQNKQRLYQRQNQATLPVIRPSQQQNQQRLNQGQNQNLFTLKTVLHAPTGGLRTCLIHKNVLLQLVTPSLLIARLSLCLERIIRIAIRDVSFMIRELFGSIRMTPEVGAPTSPAFARQDVQILMD